MASYSSMMDPAWKSSTPWQHNLKRQKNTQRLSQILSNGEKRVCERDREVEETRGKDELRT